MGAACEARLSDPLLDFNGGDAVCQRPKGHELVKGNEWHEGGGLRWGNLHAPNCPAHPDYGTKGACNCPAAVKKAEG